MKVSAVDVLCQPVLTVGGIPSNGLLEFNEDDGVQEWYLQSLGITVGHRVKPKPDG